MADVDIQTVMDPKGYAQAIIREAEQYRSPYERWKASQGIPTIRGYYVPDVLETELTDWPARGGSGVFLNLEGTEGYNDSYIFEIPPGKSSVPIHHMYDETVYILKGRGTTTVWIDEKNKQTFEWQEHSLFAIPMNAWYQHHNLSGTEPARYLGGTAAPRVIDNYQDLDFVFNCPYVFKSCFGGEDGYFQQQERTPENLVKGRIGEWQTNFIADILVSYHRDPEDFMRGNLLRAGRWALANGRVHGHVRHWPVGSYTQGHRHAPGLHVLQLTGHGYTRMWKDEEEVEMIPWGPGTIFVPPEGWFHHHFNTSPEPAYHLALGWLDEKPKAGGSGGWAPKSTREGGDVILYEDENPAVHREFEAALAKNGVTCTMGKFHPLCTAK